jgi:hyperosmotically inducible periplasmic protein
MLPTLRLARATASSFLTEHSGPEETNPHPFLRSNEANMRGAIFIFVLGVVAGAIGLNYWKQHRAAERSSLAAATDTPRSESTGILDQARDKAIDAKDAVGEKMKDWHLSGDDIRNDLERTGQVVRTRARAAGETIATTATKARVIGVIKTKYTLDKSLSVRTIEVSYEQGKVTLRGTVPSEDLIGKAVALALDTDGVVEVNSLLTVPGAGT